MKNKLFNGIMPAMITPFDEDGKIRETAARRIMNWELKGGVNGFYINGNTGEGLFQAESERMKMAEIAMDECKGRGVIINHVGAVDTVSAYRLAKHAGKIGCNAISSLVPNYIKSFSENIILDYYKRLADESGLPVLIYCTNLLENDPVSFLEKAMKIDGVIGTKFTMMNYYNLHRITELNNGDITVINGPDEMLVCGLLMGADGGIGSTYNIMPEKFVALYRSFKEGDIIGARNKQYEINRIIKVLLDYRCVDAIKEVFNIMGFEAGCTACPSRPMSKEESAQMRKDLEQAGYRF